MKSPQCIVFTGLPGTGKTSIAEAVAHELDIPVFAKDWLEATLIRSELKSAEGGPPLEQFPNRCTPWIRGFSRKPPKGSTPERRKLKGNPL